VKLDPVRRHAGLAVPHVEEADAGDGRHPVPAASSVTTIALMGIVSSLICVFGGNTLGNPNEQILGVWRERAHPRGGVSVPAASVVAVWLPCPS
jgi:hypothetical protein